jgi:multidrug resistance efflux pump
MDEKRIDRKRRVRQLLLVLALLELVMVVLATREAGVWSRLQPAAEQAPEVRASGIVQVEQVAVASEFGGRVAALPVREGQRVAAGTLLVQLDTSLLDAQIEAAEAAVAWAEAGLAQAEAGARPGQIAVARAQRRQAEAARAAATQALSDTLALVENPQDIRLQIAVALGQAEAAGYQVDRAVALKDAAEVAKEAFEAAQISVAELGGPGRRKVGVASGSLEQLLGSVPPELVDVLAGLGDGVYTFGEFEVHKQGDTYHVFKWVTVNIPLELHLTPNKWWQAWVGVNAMTAQQQGLQATLAQLYAQREHPQTLEAKVDEALAALAQAEAQIDAAQAQVAALEAGASEEQLAALAARVEQARAARAALLAEREMRAIRAATAGTVLELIIHPGEVAAPGATLLTLADLSQVRLVVYVPQTQIARLRVGQPARVTVDSFPGRVFEGEILYVADEAQFTPRNVATEEERATLVFAVEVRLENEDGALRPGMPADVVFELPGGEGEEG